jgi:tRNA(fMet)-specific endonuclease VapC
MAETYMLDTDICSFIIKERPIEIKNDFTKHSKDAICISIMTYAELLYGLEKKPSDKLARDIDEFVTLVQVIDWNYSAARQYAKIRHYLTSRGKIISDLDMQIAASAIATNAGLVTNNKKHFGVVPDLVMADWTLRGGN